jgi:hypothetical protein
LIGGAIGAARGGAIGAVKGGVVSAAKDLGHQLLHLF